MNLANKVLLLEKDLQTQKKRRAEAEKKLLDASVVAPDSRAYSHLSSEDDL